MSLGFAGLESDLASPLQETGELDAFALDRTSLQASGFSIEAGRTTVGGRGFVILIRGLIVELRCANQKGAAIVDRTLGNEIDLAFTTTGERHRRGREQDGRDEGQDRENTHGFLPKKA